MSRGLYAPRFAAEPRMERLVTASGFELPKRLAFESLPHETRTHRAGRFVVYSE